MNRLKIIISLLLLGAAISQYAQEEVKIRKKDFKTEQKEGLKEAWKSIKEGDEYYEKGIGAFPIARDHYLFANQYNPDYAELNYKIGICYLFSEEKHQAIDYMMKAYELNPEVSPEIKLLTGMAYHQIFEFDKARQFYTEYRRSLSSEDNITELYEKLDKLIMECGHGVELMQDPKRVIIQNLGEEVNSSFDDYNPRFAFNDTALYFTSRREPEKKAKRSELDNKFFEDIYISSYNGKNFFSTRTMGKPFTAKGNVAIVGVPSTGESIFIYVGDEEGGDIQEVIFDSEKGKWKKPKSLSKYIGSDAMETTAALSPDGKELYFVSSNAELSNGGKDIFVSRLNAKGRWDEPKNLGNLINSKYDEEGVYLSSDGNTMYFASKGHSTMGGFDIFKCEKQVTGSWGNPINLGYPINTPADEVFYVTDAEEVFGYYSTIREGGYGGKDIHKVIYLGSEKEMTTLTKVDLVAGREYVEPDPFLTLPTLLSVDTSLMLTGRVRDTIGGIDSTIMASLSFMDLTNGEVLAKAITGQDGYYRAKLPEAKVYGLEINSTGYLYYLDLLDLSGLNPDEPAEKDFFLQKIQVGTKVVLDNIYFETGKSVLTSESYEPLNQVAKFLQNNESVRLEISGHTDNTGSLRVNTNLSKARAKAVVDYIVGQGIDKTRLEYEGYADSQPVAPNDTAEGREKNRRVEFKVLSK